MMGKSSSEKIVLAHGGGGTYMEELITGVIIPSLGGAGKSLELEDSAQLEKVGGRLSFTTDSFVVTPRIFPGGTLGALSVIGTANDLAVSGAKPITIAISLIIEEGFSIEELKKHIEDAGGVADEAGISIVCGDTKVVPRGGADGLFITTTGLGVIEREYLSIQNIEVGDDIIISGDIGRHESAIITARGELEVRGDIKSDMGYIYDGIEALMEEGILKFSRDLTRGGLSMCLHDIVSVSDISITIEEGEVPVDRRVKGLSEILGVEPYALANEGTFLGVVEGGTGERAVKELKKVGFENASRIGIISESDGEPIMARVKVKTDYGTVRLLPAPLGETSPRIC